MGLGNPSTPTAHQSTIPQVWVMVRRHRDSRVKNHGLTQPQRIDDAILVIRGQRVMLDATLAELYGVETGALVRAVRRNAERFPADFMFQISEEEFENLRCQTGISSLWGGRRYRPYAFTEHGVAMLSSVLRSALAAQVNIEIMRAFVRHRRILQTSMRFASSWRRRLSPRHESASSRKTSESRFGIITA